MTDVPEDIGEVAEDIGDFTEDTEAENYSVLIRFVVGSKPIKSAALNFLEKVKKLPPEEVALV